MLSFVDLQLLIGCSVVFLLEVVLTVVVSGSVLAVSMAKYID